LADKKFSEFPLVTSPDLPNTIVVGLDENGDNAQFNASDIGGGITVSDTATVDLTLTGSNLTAAVVANSIGAPELTPAVDASLLKADTALQVEAPNDGTPYSRKNTAGTPTWVKPNIDDLLDVVIAAPQNNQVLTYDSAQTRWYNQTPSTGGGHVIQDEGIPRPAQPNLNFVGSAVTVTNNVGNNSTDVTITASAYNINSYYNKLVEILSTGTKGALYLFNEITNATSAANSIFAGIFPLPVFGAVTVQRPTLLVEDGRKSTTVGSSIGYRSTGGAAPVVSFPSGSFGLLYNDTAAGGWNVVAVKSTNSSGVNIVFVSTTTITATIYPNDSTTSVAVNFTGDFTGTKALYFIYDFPTGTANYTLSLYADFVLVETKTGTVAGGATWPALGAGGLFFGGTSGSGSADVQYGFVTDLQLTGTQINQLQTAYGNNNPAASGGVTSIIAGTGISVDQPTGVVTITNTGSGGIPEPPNDGTPYSRQNTGGIGSWEKPNLQQLQDTDSVAATAGQVLVYDGTSEWVPKTPIGAAGFIQFQYTYLQAITTTPAANQISSDSTVPGSITTLYVNELSGDGGNPNTSFFWEALKIGDWINLSLEADETIYEYYNLSGVISKVGNVFTVPVTPFANAGDLTPAANNGVMALLRYNGGANGHVISEEDTELPQQGVLKFTGAGVTAADGVGADAGKTVVTIAGGGGGNTDLASAPTTTTVVVTSSTGTDATIVSASGSIAGVTTAADYTRLANTSGTNTGNQTTLVTAPITNSGTGAAPNIGITAATTSVAGSMSAADKTKLDAITGTNTGNVTVTDTATIDLTITGQALTAAIVANSVGSAQLDAATDSAIVLANSALQPTIVNAKGDLISATADNTPAILSVGANNRVLAANSATATGLEWIVPSSGSSITVENEGTPLTSALTLMDFTGAGVNVTEPVADQVSINIPGSNRFAYKTAGQPIVILCTGQSNPDGTELATVQFPVDNRVKVYSYLTDLGLGVVPCPNTPAVGYGWITPNPAVTYQTGTKYPMVGYYGANKGNIPISMAIEHAETYDLPVIVLTICASGAPIQVWLEGNVVGAFTMNDYLIDFWNHIKTLPELAGVTFPDIFIWGQSESNAGVPGGIPIIPAVYNDKWQAVYEDLIANGVISREITNVYLMDTVKPISDTYKWEGTKLVARNTDNKVTFTSGITLPWVEPDDVHFTGDSNNLYGRLISQIDSGLAPGKDIHSTNLKLDLQPELSADLDANGFMLNDVRRVNLGQTGTFVGVPSASNIGAIHSNTNRTWTLDATNNIIPAMVAASGEQVIAGANTFIIASNFLFSNVQFYVNPPTIARQMGSAYTVNSNPTFLGDGAALTNPISQISFNDTPVFKL
jgi:hypothetical protein